MEREIPAWQPYDPGEPGSGKPVALDGEGHARMLVLLVGSGATDAGWAHRAALSIAQGLARTSGRTLLADLDLRNPRLHELVGVSNDEGLSDIFLWGASFQRVSHAVEPGLLFAPAGTVVVDPGAVLSSPRWESVADGFGRAHATLALYVPRDSEGLDRFLERASDVIVLAGPEEATELVPPGVIGRVRAVFGPPHAPDVAAGDEVDLHGGDASDEPTWSPQPTPLAMREERGGFRPLLWIAVVALALIALVLSAWAGWVRVPYLSPLLARAPEEVETSEGVEALPDRLATEESEEPGQAESAAPEAPVQAFSLALAAFPEEASALTQLRALRARRPDVPFFTAPVEVGGRVYHRLMAGAVADGVGAEELRASLAATFGASNAERWIVRDARQAYLLGREATATDAERRASELGNRGVQAYVLKVEADTAEPYRVYAGGYAGTAEARVLGQLLSEAGVDGAELVERTGSPTR